MTQTVRSPDTPQPATGGTRPGRRRSVDSGQQRGVRALERGLALLEALGRAPKSSLAELAQGANLAPSTAFRLLDTLQKCGFAAQCQQTGHYQLGLRAFEVGSAYLPRLQLNDVALPVMRELMQAFGETVNLAVADQADAVYVAQVEGEQMLRMFTRLGARTPAYCSGVGKALLAWSPTQTVRAVLGDGPWPASTEHTLTTFKALERELKQVRRQGYAVDNEEREVGVRCVAVPITDAAGAVVAALSLSAPTVRLPEQRLEDIVPTLIDAGRRISERYCLSGL